MAKHLNSIKEKIQHHNITIMMIVSFSLWIYLFRGFLTNELFLVRDAVAYYSHLRYFILNLAEGVYPLWDPRWHAGAPIEFFLRRVGNFNPFFSILLLFVKIGIPFRISYLIFLALYYFLGMIGFYCLAKQIFKNKYAAFVAFLLLTFSGLSTQLFFSYTVLLFTPYFWFFYFLLTFCETPKKHLMLGFTFCLMIILTTYIPFYFLTILLSFLLLFIVLYIDRLKPIFARVLSFLKVNKVLSLLCIVCLLFSLIPGAMLYKSASQGNFAMPSRHADSTDPNALTVGQSKIKGGDILTQIHFDKLISNIKDLRVGIVYIPIAAYIILLLGLLTRFTRAGLLMAIWAVAIFSIALTDTTPIQSFVYKHIFYFKFIRQSYYFFWILVLPVFILFLSEQFRALVEYKPKTAFQKISSLGLIIITHIGFLILLLLCENVIISSYVVLALSLIFCLLYTLESLQKMLFWKNNKDIVLPLFLFVLVVMQPIEAYSYLHQNAEKTPEHYTFELENIPLTFPYMYEEEIQQTANLTDSKTLATRAVGLHYSTKWFSFLFKNLDYHTFKYYLRNKILLYDQVKFVDQQPKNLQRIERAFLKNENIAFVTQDDTKMEFKPAEKYQPQAKPLFENTEKFEILDSNANSLKFKTNFNSEKFLVYNDGYDKAWRAFINGNKTHIYRTNIAFKGIYLPAGENIIHFKFQTPQRYLVDFLFMLLFYGTFTVLIILWVNDYRVAKNHD